MKRNLTTYSCASIIGTLIIRILDIWMKDSTTYSRVRLSIHMLVLLTSRKRFILASLLQPPIASVLAIELHCTCN